MDYIDGVKVDPKATPYVRQCADLIHPYYTKLEEFARIYHATAWENRAKMKKDLAELWEAYWGMEVPLYFERPSDEPGILFAEAKELYSAAKRASQILNREFAESMAVAALDLYSRSAEGLVDSDAKELAYSAMRDIGKHWNLVRNRERMPARVVRRSRTWNPPDVTLEIQEWPIKWKDIDLNHAREKRDQLLRLKVLQTREESDTTDRVMAAILYLEFQYVLLSVEIGDLKPLKETLDALNCKMLAGMSWTTRYYVMEVSQLMIPLYMKLLTYVSNHLYYEWSMMTQTATVYG
ncbi:hypothetical protein H0H93_012537 [Arthromyces matolae]|nr:hypothetical protein H0H93_012537 [Arthromyces matolae]